MEELFMMDKKLNITKDIFKITKNMDMGLKSLRMVNQKQAPGKTIYLYKLQNKKCESLFLFINKNKFIYSLNIM